MVLMDKKRTRDNSSSLSTYMSKNPELISIQGQLFLPNWKIKYYYTALYFSYNSVNNFRCNSSSIIILLISSCIYLSLIIDIWYL